MDYSFILRQAIQYFAGNKNAKHLGYLILLLLLLAILGLCSKDDPNTDIVIENVQNSADALRDRMESIEPPDVNTVKERIENEVQDNQDNSSFFMDD